MEMCQMTAEYMYLRTLYSDFNGHYNELYRVLCTILAAANKSEYHVSLNIDTSENHKAIEEYLLKLGYTTASIEGELGLTVDWGRVEVSDVEVLDFEDEPPVLDD